MDDPASNCTRHDEMLLLNLHLTVLDILGFSGLVLKFIQISGMPVPQVQIVGKLGWPKSISYCIHNSAHKYTGKIK